MSWGVLELTSYCNFNCKWCFANARTIKNPVHMSVSDVERVVDALASAGVTQITYSGGEPTLYPHLREAIDIARSHDMVVHMNTNGYLFTKNLASDLRRWDFHRF